MTSSSSWADCTSIFSVCVCVWGVQAAETLTCNQSYMKSFEVHDGWFTPDFSFCSFGVVNGRAALARLTTLIICECCNTRVVNKMWLWGTERVTLRGHEASGMRLRWQRSSAARNLFLWKDLAPTWWNSTCLWCQSWLNWWTASIINKIWWHHRSRRESHHHILSTTTFGFRSAPSGFHTLIRRTFPQTLIYVIDYVCTFSTGKNKHQFLPTK